MTQSGESIFHEARGMSGEIRDAYLKGACESDVALRARVETLLEADSAAESFLETVEPENRATADQPAVAIPDPGAVSEKAGMLIGRYKLLQPIGEGGFGSVWMAEQKEPVKRRIALKIIKLGMDTKQVIARFEAERQALAMMDHPNIAKVLDAGSTDTGRPYFVMEYVRGVGVLEYCDTEKLDTSARLRLFTTVCHAIQHAHQKGIIHRDIKPSNVMVTLHDGVPVPKVIDFGVAKATNTELTQRTLFTEHRQMIGTPAYMSPEQAEMSGLDIDTRSDIYSLGVLLYELLTGTTPFDSQELMSKGFAEMMQIIREREPHKPSTRLSTLGDTATRTAEQRQANAKKLCVLLQGDLDWIVMKCLEKDRTRRYETANGLAADIDRHLRDEPVVAGPPGQAYRLKKFLRRNRAGVLTAAVVMFALLLGISVATAGFIDASRERDRSKAAEEKVRLLRRLFGGGQVSLAVLPLENRSRDPEYDYLADGLTTTLVNDLSRISALRVVSDQSVRTAMRYSDSEPSLRSIAGDLNVDGVVTGWVEPTGDGVRLTVQLMHALTNQELSERVYEENLSNMQTLEHAVSRDIAAELELELTPQEQERLANARKIDPEAQVAYLKGSHLLKEQTRRALLRALDFFNHAIDIDPDYAAAHAGRAKAYAAMENQFAAPLDTMPYAKESALRALELDSSLAEAHSALGIVSLHFDWNWDEAEAAFKRAIELEPDAAYGYVGYSMFFSATRQPDRAIQYLETALELDPFSIINLGDSFMAASFMSGRYDRTIEYASAAMELDPELWYAHTWQALSLAELSRFDEAISEADEGRRLAELRHNKDSDDTPAHLIYAALGGICARAAAVEEDEAQAEALLARARDALATLEVLQHDQFVCPYETATVLLALGEIDAAYTKLYEAIEVRSACIPWLGVDPRLEPVRSDDRFMELVNSDPRIADLFRRIGLLPYPTDPPVSAAEEDRTTGDELDAGFILKGL